MEIGSITPVLSEKASLVCGRGGSTVRIKKIGHIGRVYNTDRAGLKDGVCGLVNVNLRV